MKIKEESRKIINKLEEELDLIPKKNICVNYYCSRSKRITELKAGHLIWGTQGYSVMGCYECKGNRIKCGAYIER